MMAYDWITVPLSYTHVVTIAVYSYLLTSLFGNQDLVVTKCDYDQQNVTGVAFDIDEPAKNARRMFNIYVPIFPLLEFIFYMGWLKVAESILNPLGQDDDDFETNYMLDRNFDVSYAIVDTYRNSRPRVDNESKPMLRKTTIKAQPFRGSAADYKKPATKKDNNNIAIPIPIKKASSKLPSPPKSTSISRNTLSDELIKEESLTKPVEAPAKPTSVKGNKTTSEKIHQPFKIICQK